MAAAEPAGPLREGRYDRGAQHRTEWFAEIAEIEAALIEAIPPGDVLELACGTGLWTRHRWKADRDAAAVDV